jgi:hypothetical protein
MIYPMAAKPSRSEPRGCVRLLVCLLLGLLGALPLVVLTPPFQVPDEHQLSCAPIS